MVNNLEFYKQTLIKIVNFAVWPIAIVFSFVTPPPFMVAGDEELSIRFPIFLIIVLILVLSFLRKNLKRTWWGIVTASLLLIGLISYFLYRVQSENIIIYPNNSENRIVIGNSYLHEVQKIVERDNLKSHQEVLKQSAVNPNNIEELYQIWPKDEITKNRTLLYTFYLITVISLSFSLIPVLKFLNYKK